jgi:hypothetical protein
VDALSLEPGLGFGYSYAVHNQLPVVVNPIP